MMVNNIRRTVTDSERDERARGVHRKGLHQRTISRPPIHTPAGRKAAQAARRPHRLLGRPTIIETKATNTRAAQSDSKSLPSSISISAVPQANCVATQRNT